MVDFVEIYKVCARKAIIEAAKKIINSDTVCHSYSDLNFGVTFLEHSVCVRVCLCVCKTQLQILQLHTRNSFTLSNIGLPWQMNVLADCYFVSASMSNHNDASCIEGTALALYANKHTHTSSHCIVGQ